MDRKSFSSFSLFPFTKLTVARLCNLSARRTSPFVEEKNNVTIDVSRPIYNNLKLSGAP